jgi:pyruvate/2-oxoglutarate dehydrogenase complex dihydrolipoamide acyltransferase (E2) component
MKLVLGAALLSLAFAASAQTVAPAADAAAPQTAAAAPAEAPVEASTNRNKTSAKDDAADHNCLKHTGSRLIRADSKGRKCAMAAGRAYNRDDIDRTGAVGLQDALRRLDPAVH